MRFVTGAGCASTKSLHSSRTHQAAWRTRRTQTPFGSAEPLKIGEAPLDSLENRMGTFQLCSCVRSHDEIVRSKQRREGQELTRTGPSGASPAPRTAPETLTKPQGLTASCKGARSLHLDGRFQAVSCATLVY